MLLGFGDTAFGIGRTVFGVGDVDIGTGDIPLQAGETLLAGDTSLCETPTEKQCPSLQLLQCSFPTELGNGTFWE
jgi:hypothetical protein